MRHDRWYNGDDHMRQAFALMRATQLYVGAYLDRRRNRSVADYAPILRLYRPQIQRAVHDMMEEWCLALNSISWSKYADL